MSKYKDVYNDIKNRIRDGILKPGEFLNSESELANEYSYSKDTIRKALSILELEGYIQKIKGKNSLILERGYLKNVSLSSIQRTCTDNFIKIIIFSSMKNIHQFFIVLNYIKTDKIGFYIQIFSFIQLL